MAESASWFKRLFGRQPDRDAPAHAGDPAGRRGSRRTPVPIGLFYFVAPDRFVELELSMHTEFSTERIQCFLFDVNETGIGFASSAPLTIGERVHIRGDLAGDLDPLLEAEALVVNARRFAPGRPRPPAFQDAELSAYGAELAQKDAMILLKVTLDCLAIHSTAGEAVTGREAAHGVINAEELNNHTFRPLPVALVEVLEEVRRRSDRAHIAGPLRFLDEHGHPRPLSLHLCLSGEDPILSKHAELVDYSEEGVRVISNCDCEPGDKVVLLGLGEDHEQPLFEQVFIVRNRRDKREKDESSAKTVFHYDHGVQETVEYQHHNVRYLGLEIVTGPGPCENPVMKAALASARLEQ